MEKHDFGIIFTSNDVIKIQYAIGKGFVYQERSYSMVVNGYFIPRIINRPHATHKYGHRK